MKLDKIVAQSAVEAVKSLYGQDVPLNLIQVQKTRPEFEGNMTLVIFPLLKISRKKPEDTAREIGEYIVAHNDFVENFSIVKGFLNFTFRAATWLSMLQDIDQGGPLRREARHGGVAAGDGGVLIAQHQQAPPPGTRAQQPPRMVAGAHPRGQWQPRGQDQYRQRPWHPYLQVDAGLGRSGATASRPRRPTRRVTT